MEKNEYRKRIEELAIVRDRKPVKTAQHNRIAKKTIVEIDPDTGEEIEVQREVFENPTLGFELIKIKDRHAPCMLGCGDVVTNQIIEHKVYQFPTPHWRTSCVNCNCVLSPDGQGFLKSGAISQNAFVSYFKRQDIIKNTTIKSDSD